MNNQERLRKLETVFGKNGCSVCNWWDGVAVICDDAETGDGSHCTRPEQCPSCGRVVPYDHVVTLHGVDLSMV